MLRAFGCHNEVVRVPSITPSLHTCVLKGHWGPGTGEGGAQVGAWGVEGKGRDSGGGPVGVDGVGYGRGQVVDCVGRGECLGNGIVRGRQ